MRYTAEQYRGHRRFNEQYPELYRFLLKAGELDFNEHYPWGRFEWMHLHSMLDTDALPRITIFRDGCREIVGLLTFDTTFDDRWYLIHTGSDRALLEQMVDAVCQAESGRAAIKVNSRDAALMAVLRERQFVRSYRDSCVLELELSDELAVPVPDGYTISPPGFPFNGWDYQMVIHQGFDHTDTPEPWAPELVRLFAERPFAIRTFVLKDGGYCAHCGLWYSEGDSAYVEPVVTVPEHRGRGLAKAAVYEACSRAKAQGAMRATVLSDQEFYRRIGFRLSSEVYVWEKTISSAS